jgi:hypothetical protein
MVLLGLNMFRAWSKVGDCGLLIFRYPWIHQKELATSHKIWMHQDRGQVYLAAEYRGHFTNLIPFRPATVLNAKTRLPAAVIQGLISWPHLLAASPSTPPSCSQPAGNPVHTDILISMMSPVKRQQLPEPSKFFPLHLSLDQTICSTCSSCRQSRTLHPLLLSTSIGGKH